MDWYHQTYETGQWDGFNDSGIETFRDNPLVNLARETIQNAIDASLNNHDAPTKVTFLSKVIDTNTIPGVEGFRRVLQLCANESGNSDTKARSFFSNAIDIINSNRITILCITDTNTTGIQGPCEEGTAYYAFMKASGLSHKERSDAAGSYGIGKLAPYVVSELRTVFVSTVYKIDDTFHQLTQGKRILTSYKENGANKSSIGFWGVEAQCMPVEGVNGTVPEWILNARSEEDYELCQGTKLTILGFNPDNLWKEILAFAVVENFFGAIADGKLEVNINNKYNLTKDELGSFFAKKEILDLVESSKIDHESFTNTQAYYKAYIDGMYEESENPNIGLCRLYLKVNDDLPKKVCILRNGMLITDQLKGLKRFNDYKDFVAIFQCLSSHGNTLLRGMEPTTHNNFIPDLLPKQEQVKGKRIINQVVKWIKEKLNEKAKNPVSDITTIDELSDYFGDENFDDSSKTGFERNPLGRVVMRQQKVKVPSLPLKPGKSEIELIEVGDGVEEGTGGGGGTGTAGNGTRGGVGNSSGTGSGGGAQRPEAQAKTFTIAEVRTPIVAGKRKISFTPGGSGRISLKIYKVGADIELPVNIITSDLGDINNGSVEIDCTKGKRISIEVELDKQFSGALRVMAYEIR